MISMVLPTSATMYARASAGNTDGASYGESTDNNDTLPITSNENSDALPTEPTVINSTGNEQLQGADFENTILNIHN